MELNTTNDTSSVEAVARSAGSFCSYRAILGLTPQALCCRALRALYCTRYHSAGYPLHVSATNPRRRKTTTKRMPAATESTNRRPDPGDPLSFKAQKKQKILGRFVEFRSGRSTMS